MKPTETPITVATAACYRLGYSPRPTGYGVLWPASPARLRELADATRRRSLWRAAAGLEALADGLAAAKVALAQPTPVERLPGLEMADVAYKRSVSLLKDVA